MKKLAILLLMLLLTGCSKSTHMIYYLKDNETTLQVAQKFNVNVEDIKADERYLMFEVR